MPPPLQSAPRPTITVGGRQHDALAQDLLRLQVDDDIHGLKRLSATVVALGAGAGQRDERWRWLDAQVLDFGAEIQVAIGQGSAQGGRPTVFDGRISALELQLSQGRTPELLLLAEDRLMDLRMTRRFRSWEEMSDADIARSIASEHGLSAAADLDGPTWPLVQQWNQSDLAFLRERARRLAGEIWLDGRTLHFSAREQRDSGGLTLVQGASLRQVALRADLAAQRSAQHISGFDDDAQQGIDEDADQDAVAAEAGAGRHGPAVLAQALGERISHRVLDVPLQGPQARALARAALLQRARRFASASGVADGEPALAVGTRLTLQRVSPLFEGEGWRVTRCSHRFDGVQGYVTHFDAERPWLGRP